MMTEISPDVNLPLEYRDYVSAIFTRMREVYLDACIRNVGEIDCDTVLTKFENILTEVPNEPISVKAYLTRQKCLFQLNCIRLLDRKPLRRLREALVELHAVGFDSPITWADSYLDYAQYLLECDEEGEAFALCNVIKQEIAKMQVRVQHVLIRAEDTLHRLKLNKLDASSEEDKSRE